MAPVDFEYDLVFIQPHPAFAVYPVTGKYYFNTSSFN